MLSKRYEPSSESPHRRVHFFGGGVCSSGQNGPIRQLSVNVDVVLLVPVTVTNERQYVGGLEKQHFQIYEDRIEQLLPPSLTEDSP
jgi:hypothetical protein